MALYHTFTLWLFNIAMENGPFLDDEHDDLPKKIFSHRKLVTKKKRCPMFTIFRRPSPLLRYAAPCANKARDATSSPAPSSPVSGKSLGIPGLGNIRKTMENYIV